MITIILSAVIIILLVACGFLYLYARLSNEMIESKDKMILHLRESANRDYCSVINRLNKIQASLKKE